MSGNQHPPEPFDSTPSQSVEIRRIIWLKRVATAIQTHVIYFFRKLGPEMVDDLIANGVVEVMVSTATAPRILIAIIVAAWSVLAWKIGHLLGVSSRIWGYLIAALGICTGSILWIFYPYFEILSPELKAFGVISSILGLGLLLLPSRYYRREWTLSMTIALIGYMGISMFATGALTIYRKSACGNVESQSNCTFTEEPAKTPNLQNTSTAPVIDYPNTEDPVSTTAPPPIGTDESNITPTPSATTAKGICPEKYVALSIPDDVLLPTYIVRPEDTLTRIAILHDTTVEELRALNIPYFPSLANDAYPNCLIPGWVLLVPG